jgi:hypothetical protein
MTALRDQTSIDAALAVLDRFVAAINAGDGAAINETFNFPHVRFHSGKVTIFPAKGDFEFQSFLDSVAGDGWHHSKWDVRDVIHAGAEKVHFDTQFSRFRADGSLIGSFRSIYIVTRIAGHWGIQGRSSFAR